MVTIEISVAGLALDPVNLKARVVHRTEAQDPSGEANLLAGMGLELLNSQQAKEAIARLLIQGQALIAGAEP